MDYKRKGMSYGQGPRSQALLLSHHIPWVQNSQNQEFEMCTHLLQSHLCQGRMLRHILLSSFSACFITFYIQTYNM